MAASPKDTTEQKIIKDVCRLCDKSFTDKKGKHRLVADWHEVKPTFTLALEELTGPVKSTDDLIAVCSSCRTLLNRYHRSACEAERIATLVKSMAVANAAVKRWMKTTPTGDGRVRKRMNIGQESPAFSKDSQQLSPPASLEKDSPADQQQPNRLDLNQGILTANGWQVVSIQASSDLNTVPTDSSAVMTGGDIGKNKRLLPPRKAASGSQGQQQPQQFVVAQAPALQGQQLQVIHGQQTPAVVLQQPQQILIQPQPLIQGGTPLQTVQTSTVLSAASQVFAAPTLNQNGVQNLQMMPNTGPILLRTVGPNGQVSWLQLQSPAGAQIMLAPVHSHPQLGQAQGATTAVNTVQIPGLQTINLNTVSGSALQMDQLQGVPITIANPAAVPPDHQQLANITEFPFTPVHVKSEDEDEEEKPQSLQLHQSQTEENREAEPLPGNSTEQMKTEADEEDCGISEPARNLVFSCSDCGKTFERKRHLQQHMRVHTGEKPFRGSDCGKRVCHEGSLKKHLISHTGEKQCICSDCGNSFGEEEALKKHMTVHTGEKQFSCSDCGKDFGEEEALKKHMTVHTGEKAFICSVCGKSYANLSSHMRVHTGEKPYNCSICSRSFSLSCHLKRHMMVHTGEKPNKCSVCGRGFVSSTDLKNHMVVHTGEKPFNCSICSKRCSFKKNLKIHMKIHTRA